MSDRTLPQAIEAERSVLGSIFLKPMLWATIESLLATDEFFLPAHREVFEAMRAVSLRHMPVDPITIADELNARKTLSRLEGGENYLMRLAEAAVTAENAHHHVSLVREAANKRAIIRLCAETVERAYGNLRTEELTEDLSTGVSRLVLRSNTELTLLGASVPTVMAEIERRAEAGPDKSFNGVRTGIAALDELTWGLEAPDLVVIGADPGGGKTALAVQAGLILAIEDKGTTFCANLEMSKVQICERALAHRAQLNSYLLRRGDLKKEHFTELHYAARELMPALFYIEDSISTLQEFEARARVWRGRHPDKKALAIFDYLQLAQSTGERGQNRTQEVGQYARRLKALAKELNIAVIAVSSLNRDSKQVAEAPPTKKNLRESGDIEYAADTIILIWNREHTEDGQVELIVEKNRKGPCRHVPGHWVGKHYAFKDLGHEEQQQLPM